MVITQLPLVQVRTRGAVPTGMRELARAKVGALLGHVGEPVLSASVVLAVAADPAVERPAAASVLVSVNGRMIRAHALGTTMPEAVNDLAGRLRVRLERAWPARRPPR